MVAKKGVKKAKKGVKTAKKGVKPAKTVKKGVKPAKTAKKIKHIGVGVSDSLSDMFAGIKLNTSDFDYSRTRRHTH
jgi:hypothetical protein